MGGIGSGRRWRDDAKNTTNDYRALDVRHWQRDGLLEPGHDFAWQWCRNDKVMASISVRAESDRIILNYRHWRGDSEWEDKNYPVRLDWTDCNFGGKRAWFLCPGQGCGRRAAILYCGDIFACRHCYRLAYPSQREAGYERAMRRADKIRARLNWQPGILNPNGWKPRRMHWNTFSRLVLQHNADTKKALDGIRQCFGGFRDPLDRLE
uniref:Uncharacterized protein n=1 Tax=Candidatus Kentrum sp. LPFa TaxID=2126335 RepID=A0A450XEN3_9GAMM|nr:MAG: hypothetical protein BECKLPF1236A_GA0070988_1005615 [Candidatus Kentron sp. LPFa]VFK27689.1 MAG: hypothetical protein BECKLPF1236C_GA0070990_1005015 [Candidatus Kentron sp. LPFa]